jgi:phosphoribosylaminoimidazole-succinocarboxamide synthase
MVKGFMSADLQLRIAILADTKLEWGIMPDGRVLLIDEVLTPDSSRFWPMVDYRAGDQSAVV